MDKPRLLKAEEIDVRVQSVKETKNGVGAVLLLYKDARVDMNILDEWVGSMNWQRTHSRENSNCTISIWDKDKNQWVSKEDTGTESNTEKEKGLASDSFKRAGFNWGIGRELYTAPFTWINLEEGEHYKGNDGKPKASPFVKFKVSMIEYDENRNIVSLIITDNKNKERFKLGNPMPESKPVSKPKSAPKPKQSAKPTATLEDCLKEGAKHDMQKAEIWNIWKHIFEEKADHTNGEQAHEVLQQLKDYGGTPLV